MGRNIDGHKNSLYNLQGVLCKNTPINHPGEQPDLLPIPQKKKTSIKFLHVTTLRLLPNFLRPLFVFTSAPHCYTSFLVGAGGRIFN